MNYCVTLIRDAVNMPKNIRHADCHFKKSIGFLMKYWNMALLDDSNSGNKGNCDGTT